MPPFSYPNDGTADRIAQERMANVAASLYPRVPALTPLGQAGALLAEGLTGSQGVVSVMNFGATGNGTTDDTSAIQNAINANPGGTIIFPAGTYKLSGGTNLSVSLQMNSPSTVLLGSPGAILKQTGTVTGRGRMGS